MDPRIMFGFFPELTPGPVPGGQAAKAEWSEECDCVCIKPET